MSERDALAPKRPEVAPKSSIPDQAIYYDSSQTPQAVRATDDIKSFFVTHFRTRFYGGGSVWRKCILFLNMVYF